MLITSSHQLRRREGWAVMAQSDPSNTKVLELAMPALDCSPTPTPYHTRAGSPVRGISTPHTAEQAKETMEAINALMPEDSEVTDARDASKPEKAELISVSIVDGSANVSAASKIVHLSIYFTFNLGLTLFNKAIMVQVGSSYYVSVSLSNLNKALEALIKF